MNLDKVFKELKLNTEFLASFKDIQNQFTDEDLARFIANTAEESLRFFVLKENMNYSTVEGLKGSYKIMRTISNPQSYVKQPVKLANLVYANRLGNGSVDSGDGWKYRGRGLIQITGKDNYKSYSKYSGVDVISNPELLETPKHALGSAVWFWKTNGISNAKDITETRARVNGPAKLGLTNVIKTYNKIKGIK